MSEVIPLKREREETEESPKVLEEEEVKGTKRVKIEGNDSSNDAEVVEKGVFNNDTVEGEEMVESQKRMMTQPLDDMRSADDRFSESKTELAAQQHLKSELTPSQHPVHEEISLKERLAPLDETSMESSLSDHPGSSSFVPPSVDLDTKSANKSDSTPESDSHNIALPRSPMSSSVRENDHSSFAPEVTSTNIRNSSSPNIAGTPHVEPTINAVVVGANRHENTTAGFPVIDMNVHKPPDSNIVVSLSNPNSIVEERAEISAQYVGKVIGKGGEMLRDLQARSGCRLDVDQNVPHGNPRILTYRGTRKKVDLAKQMVASLCTPQGNETTLPLGAATRKDLVVPASSVGKIIGRSGEMVRELQSRSLAKIQVDHTAKAYKSDTRMVSIVGTPEAVVKAEEMVLFLVANPLMDAMKAIRMLVDDKMLRGGRWGSGPPYPNMPNQGYNMTPVESAFNQQIPPQQYGGYHQAGPPTALAYGIPPLQHGFGGYAERGPETEFFPASKLYMGRIIGQKGVTINDLQKRSGCDIQINQDVPPGQDCIITIKGSRQNIEMAKQMLREIIALGPNHPYAGGGGQYGADNSQSYLHQGQSSQYAHTHVPTQVHGGYQQMGHQQVQPSYSGHLPSYGPSSVVQPYAPPVISFGMNPYQNASPVYTQHSVPGYGAPSQQHQPPPTMVLPVASAWKTASAADGQVYYYNEKTGETQWDKPAGMP